MLVFCEVFTDRRLEFSKPILSFTRCFEEKTGSSFLMANLLYHFWRCILLRYHHALQYSLSPFHSSNFFHLTQLEKASASSLRKVIRSLMESPNRSSRIYNNIKLLVYYVFITVFPVFYVIYSHFFEIYFK